MWAAKAKGVSVDAKKKADTRRVDLSMGSPVKATECLGSVEGRSTIRPCGPREGEDSVAGPGEAPSPPVFVQSLHSSRVRVGPHTAKSRKQRGRAHTGAALLNGLLFLHVESEVFEHFHGVGLAALEVSGVESMSGAPSMPRTAQLHSAEKSSHLILRFLCRTA